MHPVVIVLLVYVVLSYLIGFAVLWPEEGPVAWLFSPLLMLLYLGEFLLTVLFSIWE